MNSVHDVAQYIIKKMRRVTAMKLQKLLYYSQAWSLVWDDKPLFQARIEAWANGPVIPAVYAEHRGRFELTTWDMGNADNLDAEERHTVDSVIKFYGDKTAQQLSDLTHREAPWRDARRGVADGERSERLISRASLAEYYGSL